MSGHPFSILCPSLLLLQLSPLYGSELHYTVEYEPRYSSNITRSATNPMEEYTNVLRLAARYLESSARLEGSVGIDMEYLSYYSGTFADETRSYANADLSWSLLPERLSWVVEDLLSIEPVLSTQPWTPGNVQQTNLFSTGPSFDYRLENHARFHLDLRYMNSYANVTREFNSNRWSIDASLSQESSIASQLSVNMSWNHVGFSNAAADDYQQLGLYLGWSRQWGRSGLRVELGGTGIDFDREESQYGPHARLTLNRVISSSKRLTVSLYRGFSDATQQLRGRPGAASVQTNIISSQVYTSSEADISYRTEWVNSALDTNLNYQMQEFINAASQDQRMLTVTSVWNKGFGANVSTDLGLSYSRTEYGQGYRQDETISPFAELYLRRSPHLSYRLRVEQQRRDSSVDSSNYTDLMVFATASYRH